MSDSLDWAFCVPIHGEACAGWCLYVSGNGNRDGGLLASEESLIGDLRFTQLVGQFIGSIRHVRHLQEQRTQLSSFFSPTIIGNLTSGTSAILLAPSERDISVLFCDVRGFSRKSEQQQGNLLHLLDCVKEALSAMTRGILKYDGAIADFQGDAALGFWGWPVSLDEGPIPACLAALAIAEEFRAPTCQGDFMEGFSVGIGIAHGRAVAGQIGTKQQAKIGVFGPVVNQGSRIEGLTRKFGVTICIDEVTADFVHKHLAPHQARVRRLARIRPKGMQTAITVSELLPPFSSTSHVTDSHIQQFETAVDLVISGDWEQARAALHNLPNDGPKSFLLDQMQKRDQVPPPDWDGAFWLSEK